MAWYHSQGRSPREWYQAISTRSPRDYLSRSKSPAGTVLLLLNTTILTFLRRIWGMIRGMIWGMIWMGCADMGDDMGGVCDMGPYQHTSPISHTQVCWYGGWYEWGVRYGPISAHPTHIIPHISTPGPYHPPYQHTQAISAHHLIFFTLISQALNVKEWYYILNWSKQMKVTRMLSGLSSLQILLMSIMKCILNQEQLVRW